MQCNKSREHYVYNNDNYTENVEYNVFAESFVFGKP